MRVIYKTELLGGKTMQYTLYTPILFTAQVVTDAIWEMYKHMQIGKINTANLCLVTECDALQ